MANNFNITYEYGEILINPAVLDITANDTTTQYGTAPVYGSTISGYRYSEEDSANIFTGPISFTPTSGGTLDVGTYPIVPQGTLTAPANYTLNLISGTLTVTPKSLIATADNKSRIYGDANPVFTISYSGFVNGDDASDINTPPTANASASVTTIPGNYAITLTGGSDNNYTIISNVNGTLTITPATLTVTADLKYMAKNQTPLPTYTSTITGWKNGDQTSIVSGPTHTISPNPSNYYSIAGVYSITPSNLVITQPSKYTIVYVPGTLYVNPKGSGVKNVKPLLICIDTLINHPSGFAFVAHMAYENENATAVYVPLGADNFITALGSYSGTPPVLFLPGGGTFDIYFDGLKVTWTIKSYKVNQKTPSAQDASSTSNKCNSGIRLTGSLSLSSSAEKAVSEAFIAYPNPAKNNVTITGNASITERDVALFDIIGKQYPVSIVKIASGQGIEIDLKGLANGLYLVKVTSGDKQHIVRVIKE